MSAETVHEAIALFAGIFTTTILQLMPDAIVSFRRNRSQNTLTSSVTLGDRTLAQAYSVPAWLLLVPSIGNLAECEAFLVVAALTDGEEPKPPAGEP
jgi:hypothetical protein